MTGKRRFTYKLLQNICNEFGIKLINDYSNTYLTRDSKIKGKCISCENIFDKRYANYGGYGFVNLAPGSSGYSYYYYPADPRAIFISVFLVIPVVPRIYLTIPSAM
jgi:hypothetical protein